MITLEIDQSALEPEQRLCHDLIDRVGEEVAQQSLTSGRISVRFVDEALIRRLNRMYRKQDKVTDVLSFQYPGNHGYRGEIVISYTQAQRQAHGSVRDEVIELLVHGILHVLGYDHERPGEDVQMFSLQDAITQNLL